MVFLVACGHQPAGPIDAKTDGMLGREALSYPRGAECVEAGVCGLRRRRSFWSTEPWPLGSATAQTESLFCHCCFSLHRAIYASIETWWNLGGLLQRPSRFLHLQPPRCLGSAPRQQALCFPGATAPTNPRDRSMEAGAYKVWLLSPPQFLVPLLPCLVAISDLCLVINRAGLGCLYSPRSHSDGRGKMTIQSLNRCLPALPISRRHAGTVRLNNLDGVAGA
jgi:hypothetical protein